MVAMKSGKVLIMIISHGVFEIWLIIIFATTSQTHAKEVLTVQACGDICRHIDWAFHTNCRDRRLSTVPAVCSSSKYLDVSYNNIERLQRDSLLGYHQLITLDISNNNMTHIEPGVFLGTPQLKKIINFDNSLSILQNFTFQGAIYLKELFIVASQLSVMEETSLAGLRSLQKIVLNFNLLESLPSTLFSENPSLREINLSFNRIKYIPAGLFKGLNDLEHLEINNNQLHVVHAEAFRDLLSLRQLMLQHNNIKHIPKSLSQLTSLRILDLSFNNVSNISVLSSTVNWLEDIRFHDNPIHCECAANPLREWYIERVTNASYSSSPSHPWQCAFPVEISMYSIGDLNLTTICPPVELPPTISSSVPTISSIMSYDNFQIQRASLVTTEFTMYEEVSDKFNLKYLFIIVGCVSLLIGCIITIIIRYRRRYTSDNKWTTSSELVQV